MSTQLVLFYMRNKSDFMLYQHHSLIKYKQDLIPILKMKWRDFIFHKKDDRIDSISVSLSRGMIDWFTKW